MTADKYHLWQWGERTLSGSRFSVRLHRSLGLSLHHPAKSSQKCVSCVWEGVALRVPPSNTKGATWTSAPLSAELVPTWCQTALIHADSRASVLMVYPSLIVSIDHRGCSQVGFRSD